MQQMSRASGTWKLILRCYALVCVTQHFEDYAPQRNLTKMNRPELFQVILGVTMAKMRSRQDDKSPDIIFV